VLAEPPALRLLGTQNLQPFGAVARSPALSSQAAVFSLAAVPASWAVGCTSTFFPEFVPRSWRDRT